MGPILHQHTKMNTFIVISLALISCVAAQSFSGPGFAGSGSGSGSDRFFGAIINHLKDHFFGTDEESGSGSEDMPCSWEIPSSWDIPESWDSYGHGSESNFPSSWEWPESWEVPSSMMTTG